MRFSPSARIGAIQVLRSIEKTGAGSLEELRLAKKLVERLALTGADVAEDGESVDAAPIECSMTPAEERVLRRAINLRRDVLLQKQTELPGALVAAHNAVRPLVALENRSSQP